MHYAYMCIHTRVHYNEVWIIQVFHRVILFDRPQQYIQVDPKCRGSTKIDPIKNAIVFRAQWLVVHANWQFETCAKIFLYYFEIICCCTFAYHIIVTKHCLWLNIIGPNPNLPPVKIKNLLFYLFMEILQHKLMYKIKNLNHVYDNRNIWFMMHLICMVKWALNLDYSKFSHHLGKHSHRPL